MKTTANWTKPNDSELTAYQKKYVDLVPSNDVIFFLESLEKGTTSLIQSLPAEKLSYCYAEGKWSIPQLMLHIIDTERIFSYRILAFARGEKASLPGFDENVYAETSYADKRNFQDIIEEYVSVRKATLSLLRSLSESQIQSKGTANGNPSTVRGLAYMLAGHEVHHMTVMKEKYLK